MPNGIGRCMSFSLGNGLVFIDSLHYLNVSLDNLVKPLEKNNCYHLKLVLKIMKILLMFGMKSMKDYHDLHLKSDALLLADVYGNL